MLGTTFYCQETRLGLVLNDNFRSTFVGRHDPDLQFFGLLNQTVPACSFQLSSHKRGEIS